MPSNDMSKRNKKNRNHSFVNIKRQQTKNLLLAYGTQQWINIWAALDKHHHGKTAQTAAATKRNVFSLHMKKTSGIPNEWLTRTFFWLHNGNLMCCFNYHLMSSQPSTRNGQIITNKQPSSRGIKYETGNYPWPGPTSHLFCLFFSEQHYPCHRFILNRAMILRNSFEMMWLFFMIDYTNYTLPL